MGYIGRYLKMMLGNVDGEESNFCCYDNIHICSQFGLFCVIICVFSRLRGFVLHVALL